MSSNASNNIRCLHTPPPPPTPHPLPFHCRCLLLGLKHISNVHPVNPSNPPPLPPSSHSSESCPSPLDSPCHHRALDVPAWSPIPPGARPSWLPRLAGLPQGKVVLGPLLLLPLYPHAQLPLTLRHRLGIAYGLRDQLGVGVVWGGGELGHIKVD